MTYLFTSEQVSEGHPDKVCDRISDALLDLHLKLDNKAKTAIETLATTNRVIISGETSARELPNNDEIIDCVKNTVKEIGYEQDGFNWRNIQIENYIHRQSTDIAAGISGGGAGDQGIMFGYAKKESCYDTNYMPLAIYFANKILQDISIARKEHRIIGFEPDAKSQVTLVYDKGNAVKTAVILVSSQHQKRLNTEDVREIILDQLRASLPEEFIPAPQNILTNPAGNFIIGGPDGDTGLTGRKIIADTYGGYAPHGGGAFSGKDATKVDRSAAYMMRYLAKNIVASGLAKECLLQISYAIGRREPLSLYIDCKGTCKVDESRLLNNIREMVDLTPRGIINHLKLEKPIYTSTSSYGHFGRKARANGEFSWEKLDLIEDLKKCF
ncbi:MAG: methionine adenosyltransferase [Alphaproteobacteria bacterium]|nr:methionine adenosyltransferase [Alphaproteobacteria bacterium]